MKIYWLSLGVEFRQLIILEMQLNAYIGGYTLSSKLVYPFFRCSHLSVSIILCTYIVLAKNVTGNRSKQLKIPKSFKPLKPYALKDIINILPLILFYFIKLFPPPPSVSKIKGDSGPKEQCQEKIGSLTLQKVLIFNFEFASPSSAYGQAQNHQDSETGSYINREARGD